MGVALVELDVTRRPGTADRAPATPCPVPADLPTVPVPVPVPVSPAPAVGPRARRRPSRGVALDGPLTVLACLGAVAALGLGRPVLETVLPLTALPFAPADPPSSDPPGTATDRPRETRPPVTVGAPLVPPIVRPALVEGTAAAGRTVALTFDDGPDPTWTPQVLDLLARYRVQATFCVVGTQADAHPQLVARMRAEGHLLCDHTHSHDARLAHAPADAVRAEVLGGRDRIVAAAGPDTVVPWFRAPEGAWSPALLTAVAEGGMTPLAWSVDTLDWTRPGVDAVLTTVRRDLRPGGVVLLHDGGGPRAQTVEALAVLLPWLRAQGWTVTPPALAAPVAERP